MSREIRPSVVKGGSQGGKGPLQQLVGALTPFATAFGGPWGTVGAGIANGLVGNFGSGSIGQAIAQVPGLMGGEGGGGGGTPGINPSPIPDGSLLSKSEDPYSGGGGQDGQSGGGEGHDPYSPEADLTYNYGTQASLNPEDEDLLNRWLMKLEESNPERANYYREHPEEAYSLLEAVRQA